MTHFTFLQETSLTFVISLGSKAINFGRAVSNNCPNFVVAPTIEKPDFKPHHLYGKEGTVFTVEIGQAASEQGYMALTGM